VVCPLSGVFLFASLHPPGNFCFLAAFPAATIHEGVELMLLAGRFERLVRSLVRRLPLSDYQKTRLWATSLRRPLGRLNDWPYYRCVELATRSIALPKDYDGHGVPFPGLGDPDSRFSMLEFGVASGDGFQVLLHFRDVWLRRLRLRNKITVIGFDTFEGMPAPRPGDQGLPWRGGDFTSANMEKLEAYLSSRFTDFRLVQGRFNESLRECVPFLRDNPPVFVSLDCDYYSSTMDVLECLLPDLAPHGCLFYFDDVNINFWCERTGQLRAIAETNAGRFGSHIRLVEFPLWIATGEMRHYKQTYRLVNLEAAERLARSRPAGKSRQATRGRRISPL
jgi:Macrocin-O-methyltransferase (TylF)